MKRVVSYLISIVSLLTMTNVYACGELVDASVEGASIEKISDTEYVVKIKEGVRTVFIDATTDTSFKEGYGPRNVSTNEGVELIVEGKTCGHSDNYYTFSFETISNIIAENTEVVGESKDETSSKNDDENKKEDKTYTLELQDITVDEYDIGFKPDVYEYSFEVDSDIEKLNISTTKVNEADTVSISDNTLEIGNNEITITVVSSNGETAIYTLKVEKKKELSNNNYAANITVNGYQLNFDANTVRYDLSIGKEKSLIINVTTEDTKATYNVLNNSDLKDGSVITVRITAEDSTTRDYVINITKKFDIMAYWQYIVVGVLFIILVILLIIRGKGKKKKITPEVMETPTETAGVVNTVGATPMESINTTVNATIPTAPTQPINSNSNLQIITPTNVEGNTQVESAPAVSSQTVDNTNQNNQINPTEVFKL